MIYICNFENHVFQPCFLTIKSIQDMINVHSSTKYWVNKKTVKTKCKNEKRFNNFAVLKHYRFVQNVFTFVKSNGSAVRVHLRPQLPTHCQDLWNTTNYQGIWINRVIYHKVRYKHHHYQYPGIAKIKEKWGFLERAGVVEIWSWPSHAPQASPGVTDWEVRSVDFW